MEQLRRVVQGGLEIALAPVARGLFCLGASPNQVSVGGFALNVGTAGLVVTDHLVAAGILYLIAGTLDMLDGILARLTGTPTRFGAFLDSTMDRVSEGVVFAAIGYRFAVLCLTAIHAALLGDMVGQNIGKCAGHVLGDEDRLTNA